jgi:hypothetical protein
VGTWQIRNNRAQIRQDTIDMTDVGEYYGMRIAHETNVPLRDAFPSGWMSIGEDALV